MQLKGVYQVVSVVFSHIYDSEVVHGECKLYWSGNVFPEAWCVSNLVVSMWAQALAQQMIRQDSRLRQSIYCLANFEIDEPIFSMFVELILGFCMGGKMSSGIFIYSNHSMGVPR